MSDPIFYGSKAKYTPPDMGTKEDVVIYICDNCGNGNRTPLEERVCFWCQVGVSDVERKVR